MHPSVCLVGVLPGHPVGLTCLLRCWQTVTATSWMLTAWWCTTRRPAQQHAVGGQRMAVAVLGTSKLLTQPWNYGAGVLCRSSEEL